MIRIGLRGRLLLLLLLLPLPAEAIPTLTAIGGSIGVVLMDMAEPGVWLTGKDWSRYGWAWTSCCVYGPESETFGYFPLYLQFHGATFAGDYYHDATYGQSAWLSIKVDPAIPEGDCNWLTGVCEPYVAPFTMTGYLPFAGGVDIVGQGTVTRGLYASSDTNFSYWRTYTITAERVPEPASGLLLGLALLALIGFYHGIHWLKT